MDIVLVTDFKDSEGNGIVVYGPLAWSEIGEKEEEPGGTRRNQEEPGGSVWSSGVWSAALRAVMLMELMMGSNEHGGDPHVDESAMSPEGHKQQAVIILIIIIIIIFIITQTAL
ncbi:hypothetical protein EYF80_066848 [Liparis tanakae]|uniref:Uncharacterized protein n=1 Tax=Liparis tanakae TaxID=230148 RepID=A0A4Z2E2M3_9TELE|nr:hypothetical protein EYF80_066848 [Liparis tanakae]